MTGAAPKMPITGTTLDDLARMRCAELGALYAEAPTPDDLRLLDGQPTGRMLAVRGVERTPLASPVVRWAASAAFPWGGKSFRSESADRGRGINRVRLGGRHQLFPFRTDLAPSEIDGRGCVRLDYDLSGNPGVIRAIHDEVRAIEPGLFLGPAMIKRGDRGPTLALWFALDTRVQATRPVWG